MSLKNWGRHLVISLSVIAFSGCLATKLHKESIPSWINTPPIQKNILYGIGSAEIYSDKVLAIEQARDMARTSLLKQLKVEVAASTNIKQNEVVIGNQSEFSSSIRVVVRSKLSPIEMAGLKMEETYEDGKIVYALVSLNRQLALKNIQIQISEIDALLNKYQQVSESLNKLAQLKQLLPAITLIEQRKELQQKFFLLNMQHTYFQKNMFSGQIENRIYILLDELKVMVRALNPAAAKMIQSRLHDKLTSAGIRVVMDQENADVIIEFEILGTRKISKNWANFVYTTGNIRIKDAKGRILKSYTKEVKGAASDIGLAYLDAVKKMANALGEQLSLSLLSHL